MEDKTRVLERERRTVKAPTVAACDRYGLRVADINALHAHHAREVGERLKAEHSQSSRITEGAIGYRLHRTTSIQAP